MCGKKSLKNQQCWLKDVSCGQICGRKLKCGSHFCTKPCHRDGECEDAGGRPCQQPCGKPKKACDHPDEAICHAPTACKEDKACTHKIFITCECQAQKQEMRCNASKTSEGNLTKSLPCNEECARLERNRKLALALNIDQEAHVEGGDHVPFSNETLNLYAAHPTWSTNQEREFRVFAAADDEKRLRFKPMTSTQRAFIHHLAEDFGLDSESMDPEPHRHVAIFKTPRFVRSPPKTLKESARIRNAQRLASGKAIASNEAPASQVRANEVGEPFNSYVVVRPRFGLTIEEVRTELASFALPVQFDVEFLPNEEVIIKSISRTLDEQAVDQTLKNAKVPIATAIAAKSLGTLQLCRTDSSLNITRRETENGVSDGWSRVAAKSAASRRPLLQTASSNNNSFSALAGGNKVTFAKKKEKKPPVVPVEPVVEDWEAAEMAEEEKEKLASGHNSGAEDEVITAEPSNAAGTESLEAGKGTDAVDAPVAEAVPEADTVVDGTQTEADVAGPEVVTSVETEQAREAETA
jgi:transcriptional repressor NF-X1